MKITIYDVAEKAGVSIATVSKVINNTGRISDKTRKKVWSIMEELDYQPSAVASALSGKSTFTIGLTLPDLANPYFAEIARAIEDQGRKHGFNVFMCSTDNDASKEEEYYQLFMKKRVDGIIMVSRDKENVIVKKILNEKVPLVMIAREFFAVPVTSVMVDDYYGGMQAGQHLLEQGHQRIAVIVENLTELGSKERLRGASDAAKEADIAIPESYVIEGGYTLDSGKAAMKQLLMLEQRPTAVFACNDILAIGAIQAVRESGLRVPEDISIVGYDNTILATIVDPPLTTVAQPIKEIGERAVALLVEQIQSKESLRQRVVLMPDLVVRQSTCAIDL
ncbi:LacI family DNA-binding transcriptional regulator [Paenibacillus camelliae]|uniref:LacI family DNA-binding transcriptional regulator n=1 Tax=Paenibacillus camelliae TaxID=512410 RepID=UPI00203FF76A|nr:LacI family DNA-binding transcriptional regulator [Paenibacillus camelliae]MCM3633889.1 LacI family transcriptional regulator [Paenibacillus camelliae]